jgi:hypothetical protein
MTELPSWLVLTDFPEADAVMQALTRWLREVYLRYPDAELPACWAWHPEVVEELWWLRNSWYDAYTGPKASWAMVGIWHESQRPGVVTRVGAAKTCGLEVHVGRAGDPPPAPPLSDALPQVVTAWASPHHAGWPLEPTRGQLADARAHDDDLSARRRAR